MSIARVETPSACSRSSSPGIRADASSSVAPQLRIDLRSTRLYSAANAAAIATATIRDLTRETAAGRLAWEIHTPILSRLYSSGRPRGGHQAVIHGPVRAAAEHERTHVGAAAGADHHVRAHLRPLRRKGPRPPQPPHSRPRRPTSRRPARRPRRAMPPELHE